MNQTIAAVLEWHKASRELAHLGADNHFQPSPDKEQLFKEKREQAEATNEPTCAWCGKAFK